MRDVGSAPNFSVKVTLAKANLIRESLEVHAQQLEARWREVSSPAERREIRGKVEDLRAIIQQDF
jgi:hypothetical protein